MAEKKKSSKKKSEKSAGVGDRMREGAERMRETGKAMAENSSVVSMKMIDQAEENARSAFAAMRAAAGASDVGDVMRIQGDFLREQGERSMSHAREISELIAEFGRDAVSTIRGDD